jgi:hypothetical protein
MISWPNQAKRHTSPRAGHIGRKLPLACTRCLGKDSHLAKERTLDVAEGADT